MTWTPPLAERVRNLKPSVTLAIDAKAKAMKAEGVDIVNLSVGEPDFDTPQHIKDAAHKAIDDGFTKYTAVGGIIELKGAIIDKIKNNYQIHYKQEEIMVSTGGKQAIYNILQAIVDPEDEVIIPVPYWVSYPPMVELAGGKPVFVQTDPETNFALDVGKIGEALTAHTRAIILNSPSNPTGSVFTKEQLRDVAELAVMHGFIIISDDIYDAVRYDGCMYENVLSVYPEAKEHTVLINGVSKTYAMTGWRIGYAAGPASIIKAATKIQGQSTSNPNSIAQKAAVAAYTGEQGCVTEMVTAFAERRAYVLKRLAAIAGVTCVEPAGAFYVFPDISSYFDKKTPGGKVIDGSLALADYLLESARIAAVPGVAFGDDRFIRFSYAASLETLKKGMDRFEEALGMLIKS